MGGEATTGGARDRRRPGRPAAGGAALTRERILATALRLVDRHGLAALTMRRLAAELGVDPMAIYHHLPGKDVLIAGLVRQVRAELRLPPAGATWQDRVRAFARAHRALFLAHPQLLLPLVTDPEAAAGGALEMSEELFAALAAAGLPPHALVRAADLVVDYVHGFALAECARPLGQASDRQELLARLAAQPDLPCPTLRRVYGTLSDEQLAGDFEFGLEVIIRGLERLARDAGAA